jgi:hypothetical protein
MATLHYHRDCQQWHDLNGSRPVTDGAILLTESFAPRTVSDLVVRQRIYGAVTLSVSTGTTFPPTYMMAGLRFWIMTKLENASPPTAPSQPTSTDHVIGNTMLELGSLGAGVDGLVLYQWRLPETLVVEAQHGGDGTGFSLVFSTWLYTRDQYGVLSTTWNPDVRWETSGIATNWWGTTVFP